MGNFVDVHFWDVTPFSFVLWLEPDGTFKMQMDYKDSVWRILMYEKAKVWHSAQGNRSETSITSAGRRNR
jgi:hypothetical protein